MLFTGAPPPSGWLEVCVLVAQPNARAGLGRVLNLWARVARVTPVDGVGEL